MTHLPFDKEKYHQISHQQWEQSAAGWHKWNAVRAEMLQELRKEILEAANIGSGSRVLEVAAGDGLLSGKVAAHVGADGYVLATDVAENMVAHIAEAAKKQGLSNIESRVMDGQKLSVDDETFDAVICNISLMLFADPGKGLSEAYRVLKPGGRYVATVFTTPDKTPWLAIPAKIALEHAGRSMPPPGRPGLFALGKQEQLEELMQKAGFRDVKSKKKTFVLSLKSATECMNLVRDSAAAIKGILAGLDEDKQRAVWQAIEKALTQFEGEKGFRAPGEILLVSGTR